MSSPHFISIAVAISEVSDGIRAVSIGQKSFALSIVHDHNYTSSGAVGAYCDVYVII